MRDPQACGPDVIAILRTADKAGAAHLAPAPQTAPAATSPASKLHFSLKLPSLAIKPDAAEADPIPALTPTRWRQLVSINTHVNKTVVAQTDLQTFGVNDYWALPSETEGGKGDCEDYVLEKRQALIQAGFAPESLNIAIVETASGEAHAVLLVATKDGEFVLDNLTPWVRPWQETPYKWQVRQVGGQAFHWVVVPTPTV